MAADAMRELGNTYSAQGDHVNAMKCYSKALASPNQEGAAALYSNRSFAFLRLKLPARALADADEAIKLRPQWPKGHFRRAEALTAAGLYAEALLSYEKGSSLDPSRPPRPLPRPPRDPSTGAT